MQTNFTPKQLENPRMAEADTILRRCVHCGFCTATCPTYVLLGDERDSPRGRIYLMKEMFEHDREASPEVQHHVDRCLSCLSCMTTCPSGVDYMHLVDLARAHIEADARRAASRSASLRSLLADILPYPDRFRLALRLARLGAPFASLLRRLGLKELAAMLELAPRACRRPSTSMAPAPPRPAAERRAPRDPACRLRPAGAAARHQRRHHPPARAARRRRRGGGRRRLLRRAHPSHGPRGSRRSPSPSATSMPGRRRSRKARSTPSSSTRRAAAPRSRTTATCLRASRICGARGPHLGLGARHDGVPRQLRPGRAQALVVAPSRLPLGLLAAARPAHHGRAAQSAHKAGFSVVDVPEGHICCGSAGTYNILQPEIAAQLRDRKVANIDSVAPTSSPPATSAASRSCRARSSPSRTPSSCWIGPTAAQCRAAWRSWRSSCRTCPKPNRKPEEYIDA